MIEQFLNKVKITKADNTHLSYEYHLKSFGSPIEFNVPYLLTQIKHWQNNGISSSTIKQHLICYKQYMRFCKIKDDDVEELIKEFKVEEKIESPLPPEAVESILNSIHNIKYVTIFLLMSESGMRVNEVATLDINDYLGDTVIIRKPKNKKEEIIKISSRTKEMLDLYVKINKPNGKVFGISKGAIQKQIKHYCTNAGYPSGHCHVFRHAFCQRLIDAGINLPVVQACMRHKSYGSTQRYFTINNKQTFNAIESVFH